MCLARTRPAWARENTSSGGKEKKEKKIYWKYKTAEIQLRTLRKSCSVYTFLLLHLNYKNFILILKVECVRIIEIATSLKCSSVRKRKNFNWIFLLLSFLLSRRSCLSCSAPAVTLNFAFRTSHTYREIFYQRKILKIVLFSATLLHLSARILSYSATIWQYKLGEAISNWHHREHVLG